MRLIPRNTKVQTSFYKGLTLLDVALGVLCLLLVALTVSSNLSYKFVIALGIVCVFIPMFMQIGEERVYKCALYLGKFLFSRKAYFAGGKDAANIENVVPYEDVEGNCILNKDGSVTGVIEIKPMEFRLLGSGKQNYLIDGVLASALSSITAGQQAALVKLEKPLDLDGYIQSDLKRIVALADANKNGTLSEDEYRARVDVIDDRLTLVDALNSKKSVKYSAYYLTVTDKSKASLMTTLSVIRGHLSAGSVEARILDRQALSGFLYAAKHIERSPDETVIPAPKNVTFRLTNTLQDERQLSHFVLTGYPLKVPNAWGEELFDLPGTKVVMRLQPVEKSKAVKRIDNAIMELSTQAKGKASRIIDKTTHMETLSELLVRLQNDNEILFDVTFLITVYDKKGKADN